MLVRDTCGYRLLLAATSGLLLSLAFVDSALYWTTWFALVPLLLAIDGRGALASYGYGLIAGLAWSSSTAPWIIDFLTLFKGLDSGRSFAMALLFWFYGAQLLALLVGGFSLLGRYLPAWKLLLFPLLLTLFHADFPMLFKVQLGTTQADFPIALQGAAITGVYGIDFALGLSNVLIYQWLRPTTGSRLPQLVAVAFLAFWFLAGAWSLDQWDHAIGEWPRKRIGIVQPHDRPVLIESPVYPGFSRAYPPELAMTERLVAAGAELVIWPEGRRKQFFDEPRIAEAIAVAMKRLGADLLLQDQEQHETGSRFNSITLIDAHGDVAPPYRKIKRVAFGEVLPLADVYPPLGDAMKRYFGPFFGGIDRGDQRSVFDGSGMRLVPLICYETIFPIFAAEGLPANPTGAVFVAVSSNTWFGASRQPWQHVKNSVLRAVESRVPLIHVLNNGPSVVVLPSGRVPFESPAGKPGGFVHAMPYSQTAGGSFFSRHPHAFIGTIHAALGALMALALWRGRRIPAPELQRSSQK